MTILTGIVRRIKDDSDHILDAHTIEQIAGQLGLEWRERILDPVTTVRLFLLQVLNGNVACAALPHIAKMNFTASAYCQARARLPLELFTQLCGRVAAGLLQTTEDICQPTFFGHRVFLVDGSSCTMPDTPELQEHFGQPSGMKAGCGFPVAHILCMFDAGSGLLLKMIASYRQTHDLAKIGQMHGDLEPGDLLLGDRAFCSYGHFGLLKRRGLHGLFRLHQRIEMGKGMCRPVKRLGPTDWLVEWTKPNTKPVWMDRQTWDELPPTLRLRQVSYQVHWPGFRTKKVTIVTSLLDPDVYPRAELARLYHLRWTVEGHLLELKHTLGMDVLRTKTVEGVLKEMSMFAVVYNLVRLAMIRSARTYGLDLTRVSFIDGLRWLRNVVDTLVIPLLLLNPFRPGRVQPRVRKRRPSNYPLMTRPRAVLLAQILGLKPAMA